MSEAFKQRIRNLVNSYSKYMPRDAATRRVKRNYSGRLDLQIDAALKGKNNMPALILFIAIILVSCVGGCTTAQPTKVIKREISA